MFDKIYACDMARLECYYRGEELTDQEYGKYHKYFRCVCNSNGLYKDSPCSHALYSYNGEDWHWLVKKRRTSRDGECRIVKVGRNPRDKSLV